VTVCVVVVPVVYGVILPPDGGSVPPVDTPDGGSVEPVSVGVVGVGAASVTTVDIVVLHPAFVAVIAIVLVPSARSGAGHVYVPLPTVHAVVYTSPVPVVTIIDTVDPVDTVPVGVADGAGPVVPDITVPGAGVERVSVGADGVDGVGTVTVDTALVALPAGSTAVVVIVYTPGADRSPDIGGQENAPVDDTLHTNVVGTPGAGGVTVTVTPLADATGRVTIPVGPVPGDVSAAPVADTPIDVILSTGAILSTPRVYGSVGDIFPAASVFITERELVPCESGTVGTIDQLPAVLTYPLPTTVVPESIDTIVPGSPVPVIVGVGVATVDADSGDTIVGAVGAIVSTISAIVIGVLAIPLLPICVPTRVLLPSGRADVTGHTYVPDADTVVVHTVVPARVNVTVAPGAPLPVMVGVGLLVLEPLAGADTINNAGVELSIVNVTLDTGDTFPAASVCVTVAVVDQFGRDIGGVTDHTHPAFTVPVRV
jgi:hypothetical protein